MLDWSEEFSIKNPLLDNQHKYLFNCLAIAHRLANSPIDNKASLLQALIKQFLKYAITHFKEEEAHMERICYPSAERHKNIHKGLVNVLRNFRIDPNDPQRSCDKFYVFSKNWLINHILKEDKQLENYRHYLADAGEIPYSLAQQTKIFALEHDIQNDKCHSYICLCPLKVLDVCLPLHDEMQTQQTFLRCKVCKQPLVPVDERLQEEQYYQSLIKKYCL